MISRVGGAGWPRDGGRGSIVLQNIEEMDRRSERDRKPGKVTSAQLRTFWLAAKDHALDDGAVVQAAAHDLDDAHVVDVEVLRVRGHDR